MLALQSHSQVKEASWKGACYGLARSGRIEASVTSRDFGLSVTDTDPVGIERRIHAGAAD
jgi:hypothetical protein